MKLKLIVKLVEKMLGQRFPNEASPADMYLPNRTASTGLVFLTTGIASGIVYAFNQTLWMLFVALGGLAFGIAALMCWKNQSIRVLSDEYFEYKTMFGRIYTYAFRDITRLKRNQDSLTLFVGEGKVHIESNAVISERLAELINREFR